MGVNSGRRGSRWIKLKAEVRTRGEGCIRCGQPIDYQLEWPDPGSFSVDHWPHPLSTHPHLAEDIGNLRAAHLRCNQTASNKAPAPTLGSLSEDW